MIETSRVIAGARRRYTGARVRAALAGRGTLPPLDLAADANGAVEELVAALRGVSHSSSLLWWVRAELTERGDLDEVLNGVGSAITGTRILCARLAGALRLEESVPWLGRLLAHDDDRVQAEAARSLGIIRGARSADALVRALYWRRGATRRVVLELTRAAPDHYLESALLNPDFVEIRQHLALAIGLRGHRMSVPALLMVHDAGVRSERVAVCRALGWIGDRSALPLLVAALDDDTWQVRTAAIKALARVADSSSISSLEGLLEDRHADVRIAAQITLAHLRRRDARAARRAL